MKFIVIDPQLGPIEHQTIGLQAMRSRIWELAASGTTIIIEEERSYEERSELENTYQA